MNVVHLVPYQHSGAGFGLALPAGWETVENPGPGVALVAVEPEHDLGFRASVVVTVDDLPAGLDLATWQAHAEQVLAASLHDYLLLDLETVGAGDRPPLVRRLAHHLVGDTEAVTMRQWAAVTGRRGLTLTASVATLAYDSLADTFDAVADAFSADAVDAAGGSTG